VIAYSTFPGQPPATSFFWPAGQGVSLQSNQAATAGVQVACVNPAALAVWHRRPRAVVPRRHLDGPATAGHHAVGLLSGAVHGEVQECGRRTWLQVNDVGPSGDTRPVVTEALGPNWATTWTTSTWATGNLVADVRTEEAAYTASHH